MAKTKTPTVSLFVGGRPIEELPADERKEWERRAVERMGQSLNNYFSHHVEEYQRIGGRA